MRGKGSHTFGELDFQLSPVNAYDVGFNYITLAESKGFSSGQREDRLGLDGMMGKVLRLNEDVTVCNPCYEQRGGTCLCYIKKGSIVVMLKDKNAEMLFKLWRDKPESQNDEADFYYRIRFVPY